MLLNRQRLVWVGERQDAPGAWQMPQGGIDAGESAAAAAMRELHEEVGTDKAEIIAESKAWLTYDLPRHLAKRSWSGRWRGQRQKWFLLRFTGEDRDVDVSRHHPPEFSSWRWVGIDALVGLAVSFKRPLYECVVEEFRHLATSFGSDREKA
ncbi:MAG: RNA pyrophosphohydrolase [Proteobacteria bacterium]|nr:RNA pyrophosphohydrolase [Pseudomonadota bacterium]MBI3499520.1 RNA pyrophosphohydrolase [Pseudomonadota bacterium]